MMPKAHITKENKKIKLNFIKTKNFCALKDGVNRVRRKSVKYKKKIVNYVTEKELISRIYSEIKQEKSKPIKKTGKGLK